MKNPVWELNIRPMFRALDRRQMLWRLDLWKYEDVRNLAPKIANRAAKDMPPVDHGGPWPQEWVDLFKRWMTSAPPFARLDLATGKYTAVRDAAQRDHVKVTAAVVRPSPKSSIWFEEDPESSAPFAYVLYLAKESDPPHDIPDEIEDDIVIPESVSAIAMRAADGIKQVPIT